MYHISYHVYNMILNSIIIYWFFPNTGFSEVSPRTSLLTPCLLESSLIPLQAPWTVFVLVHLASCFAQITLSLGRQAGDGMSFGKAFWLEISLPRGSCNRFGHPIHSQIRHSLSKCLKLRGWIAIWLDSVVWIVGQVRETIGQRQGGVRGCSFVWFFMSLIWKTCQGHYTEGAELIDSVLDVVRKEAEGCDWCLSWIV